MRCIHVAAVQFGWYGTDAAENRDKHVCFSLYGRRPLECGLSPPVALCPPPALVHHRNGAACVWPEALNQHEHEMHVPTCISVSV